MQTPEALEAVIANHPFTQGLRPEHLRILAEAALEVTFAEGEVIFREGEMANRFYLILEGEVAIESHAPDRPPIRIQTVGAGDVLGWSWLFPPYYWNFAARALRPTRAVFFYGTRLRERCEEDHDIGYELIKRSSQVMLRRLQITRRQLLALSPKN